MHRARLDAPIPLLACATLFLLALLPRVAAFDPLSSTSSPRERFDLSRIKFRFKQHKTPHYSHRAPGTKRQNAAQGLLCALGVAAACDNLSDPAVDMSSDPLNCGAVGKVCLTPTGTTAIACVAGVCLATDCASGYTLAGGSCAAVPFAADSNNCGRVGTICSASFPHGLGSTCDGGQCRPVSCDEGYAWDASAGACIDAQDDERHCGTVGTVCGDGQTCSSGHCVAPPSSTASFTSTTSSTSTSPSSAHSSAATKAKPTISASARARQRRAVEAVASTPKRAQVQLCPETLTACPIAGSASFPASASRASLSSAADFLRALSASARGGTAGAGGGGGGYECIDTRHEADSCGGCVTLGQGVDCTSDIPHARSTGCEGGRCVVFGCERGWRPDREAGRCVRVSEGKVGKRHREGRRRLH